MYQLRSVTRQFTNCLALSKSLPSFPAFNIFALYILTKHILINHTQAAAEHSTALQNKDVLVTIISKLKQKLSLGLLISLQGRDDNLSMKLTINRDWKKQAFLSEKKLINLSSIYSYFQNAYFPQLFAIY